MIRLAISTGEPASIGPDVVLNAAMQTQDCLWVAFGDINLLAKRAEQLNLNITLKKWNKDQVNNASLAGTLWVNHVALSEPVVPGKLNPSNSQYVLELLKQTCDGCLNNEFDAMVTAPVHKGVINDAGVPFSGHTEFLEARTKSKKVVMMLACPQLKVALATTHLPLKDVANKLSKTLLREIINQLLESLTTDFGIQHPTLLIAGLNPHAGENGHMGSEEIDIINPILKEYDNIDATLIGPLPADTLFTPPYLEKADAVLAMYHDQGLPVLKCLGFGKSVNITLGLPIIRTSVDHGTALELAGTGKADHNSLLTAINYAQEIAAVHRNVST